MLYDPLENEVPTVGSNGQQLPTLRANAVQNKKPRWNARLRSEAIKEFVEIERSADGMAPDGTRIYLGLALLQDVRLDGEDLSKVSFWGADLSNASLRKAELRSARFAHADLRQSDLTEANLEDADLHAGLFTRCILSKANLKKADFSACPDRTGGDLFTDLKDAFLRDAILEEANLSDADLTGADLTNANLRGANLDRANLTNAILRGVDARDVNFTKVELTGAIVDKESPGFQVLDSKVKEAGWVLSPDSGTDFRLSKPKQEATVR